MVREAPFSRHLSFMTERASSFWGAETTLQPSLMMPAFSPAISERVWPRKASWSMEMGVSTAASGQGMTLVESSRPPMPASRITTLHFFLRKYKMAAAVSSSNSVGRPGPSFSRGRAASRISSVMRARSSSLISLVPSGEQIRICSVYLWIQGEEKTPQERPEEARMEERKAQTEPLPLVPATWTYFRSFWGSPRRERRAEILSRPGMDPLSFTFCIKRSTLPGAAYS